MGWGASYYPDLACRSTSGHISKIPPAPFPDLKTSYKLHRNFDHPQRKCRKGHGFWSTTYIYISSLPLSSMWSWVSYLTTLCPGFLPGKMRIIIVPISEVILTRQNSAWQSECSIHVINYYWTYYLFAVHDAFVYDLYRIISGLYYLPAVQAFIRSLKPLCLYPQKADNNVGVPNRQWRGKEG